MRSNYYDTHFYPTNVAHLDLFLQQILSLFKFDFITDIFKIIQDQK